jgi:hypothetical protein
MMITLFPGVGMEVETRPQTTETSSLEHAARRKHRKFRYRGTRKIARKVLFGLAIVSFWAAVIWLWYYLVNLPPGVASFIASPMQQHSVTLPHLIQQERPFARVRDY